MLGHEPLGVHKHAARAAAGVVHAALVGLQHFYQQLHHAARRVELPALLALSQRKLAQKVLEHAAQHVGAAGFGVAQRDIAHQVN